MDEDNRSIFVSILFQNLHLFSASEVYKTQQREPLHIGNGTTIISGIFTEGDVEWHSLPLAPTVMRGPKEQKLFPPADELQSACIESSHFVREKCIE